MKLFLTGSRDIVGYGSNGNAIYWDQPGFPCPAIRFKEATPEVLQLQEKEKGDWKALSVEEKKACKLAFCYLIAFCLFVFSQ